jgi:four helix bundle protein
MASNIAEGTKRLGSQDFIRFINIAEGSIAETEYLIILSRDLEYLTAEASAGPLAEATEIARMLNALRVKIGQSKVS